MSVWRPLSIGVLAIVSAACTPLLLQQPDEPLEHTYLLEWNGDEPAPSIVASGPVLLVSPVLAAPGYDGSDMAYMRHPHELEYFAKHRWVDAPARMLDPLWCVRRRKAACSAAWSPRAAVRASTCDWRAD